MHCIVTGGGLSQDGTKWVSAPPHFLFPVRALAKVFRGKYCAGLQQLYEEGPMEFHGQLLPLARRPAFQALLGQAVQKPWVVYAKRPFAGPKAVLAYLSRYTHRVALHPSRLLAVDEQNHTVNFTWKDYAAGGQHKVMTLKVEEFVRRFCLHLLPERFVKIRHYGFLSNRQRQVRLAQARALLVPVILLAFSALCPAPVPEPLRVCPHCGSTRLKLVEIVPPPKIQLCLPLDSS